MIGRIIPTGNWHKQISHPLQNVMYEAMRVLGKSGEEVTKWAVILMSQSARKITPKAPARRKIEKSAGFPDFVTFYKNSTVSGGSQYPVFLPSKTKEPVRYEQQKAKLLPIQLAGLAKASWMWPLKKLGMPSQASKFIDRRGVTNGRQIAEAGYRGYEITNRLSYILDIMPSGWEATVERAASKKMAYVAEQRLSREFRQTVTRARSSGVSLGSSIARALT